MKRNQGAVKEVQGEKDDDAMFSESATSTGAESVMGSINSADESERARSRPMTAKAELKPDDRTVVLPTTDVKLKKSKRPLTSMPSKRSDTPTPTAVNGKARPWTSGGTREIKSRRAPNTMVRTLYPLGESGTNQRINGVRTGAWEIIA